VRGSPREKIRQYEHLTYTFSSTFDATSMILLFAGDKSSYRKRTVMDVLVTKTPLFSAVLHAACCSADVGEGEG
jgi:hypothetical protein